MSSEATTTDGPTAAESAVPQARAPGQFWADAAARAVAAWEPIEKFLVRAGDWLNPILVKETRQAIKSFQIGRASCRERV